MPNRLSAETSPYLLQHADNPVDWHAWNDDALERSRCEDKPILLSIGYSACHWCHVMEHESFEDDATAELMNELFICIKVDREERPDLDKIYQLAHQLLTQRGGGWPLTMFLTPNEHAPMYAGTYFPKQPRPGMLSFADVLQRVADHYKSHKLRMPKHAEAVRQALEQIQPTVGNATGGMLDNTVLMTAYDELARQFDSTHGGFGAAPKFPHPTHIDQLLRHWVRLGDTNTSATAALQMANHTLQAMADGGIYDHLAGGFCRYSVDERWEIPHFEKMLYDNAQLLVSYTDAAVASGDSQFRRVAGEVGNWVMRDMQAKDGGYYSTLDADSEGEEGKFYVWADGEIRQLLSSAEWDVVAARFELDKAPNFEGKWHLKTTTPVATLADAGDIDPAQAETLLESARQKLLHHREQRIWPGLDDKVLTSWNGMMIKGMAHAGRFLDRPDFVESARRAADFVARELWHNGRLMATTRNGKAHLNAYLDDYVLLAEGLLELCQARWSSPHFQFAIDLIEATLNHFEDREHGGFYFTSDDHEQLLHRQKPVGDDATPSGNGVAALVLLRFGHLLGDDRYLSAAERTLQALAGDVQRFPSAHCSLLNALEEYLDPTQTVVLRGHGPELQQWMRTCHDDYAPHRIIISIPDDALELVEALSRHTATDKLQAYVCDGFACRAPITEMPDLQRALNSDNTAEV
jgi:hypothetical protein